MPFTRGRCRRELLKSVGHTISQSSFDSLGELGVIFLNTQVVHSRGRKGAVWS